MTCLPKQRQTLQYGAPFGLARCLARLSANICGQPLCNIYISNSTSANSSLCCARTSGRTSPFHYSYLVFTWVVRPCCAHAPTPFFFFFFFFFFLSFFHFSFFFCCRAVSFFFSVWPPHAVMAVVSFLTSNSRTGMSGTLKVSRSAACV